MVFGVLLGVGGGGRGWADVLVTPLAERNNNGTPRPFQITTPDKNFGAHHPFFFDGKDPFKAQNKTEE